jgi:hypothetical protein
MGAYKYGAKVPKKTAEALAIDKAAGNTLWQDAIRKEVGALMEMETFKLMPSETKVSMRQKGYQMLPLRCIFNIKQDTYLNMELAIPRDSYGPEFARVTKRLKDKDGLPNGRAHNNSILNTRMYKVEYPGGHKASLAANVIAENMFAQVNDEGNRHVLFEKIIDHQTDGTEVKQQDAFLTTPNSNKRRRETMKGWELLIQWKNGSTAWVSMKDIKGSYPVQLA